MRLVTATDHVADVVSLFLRLLPTFLHLLERPVCVFRFWGAGLFLHTANAEDEAFSFKAFCPHLFITLFRIF